MASFSDRLRREISPSLRFVLAALIVVGLRLPTVDQAVVDWDESVYLAVAQDLVEGGRLYDTVWDHKGPFLYAALAPAVWIADGQIAPVRWYATLWVLLTMFFVDLIARRTCSAEWSVVAALAYGLFFSLPRFGGLAANSELFMMLPVTIAVWLAVTWISTEPRRWLLISSGLFAATAVFIKTTAVFSVAVIPALIVVRALPEVRHRWRRSAADLAVFASAPAVMFLVILGWFAATDRLQDYLFATFGFNSAYVAGIPFLESWERYAAFFAWAIVGDVLTAVAVIGAVFLGLRWSHAPGKSWVKVFLVGVGVFSFLGVISARNLFFHYYLQMALPVAIVITIFVAALEIAPAAWRRLAWIALILGVVSAFSPHRFDPEGFSRKPDEDRVLTEVSAYVRDNSRSGDEIYVLGGEPVLYYLCQRGAPTRYFFWLYLTDRWDAILESRSSAMKSFAENPPDWFIYSHHDLRVPEVEALMFSRYALVLEIGDYQVARIVTP